MRPGIFGAAVLVTAAARGQELFSRADTSLGSMEPWRMIAIDVDGDGDLDLVASGKPRNEGLHVLTNSGTGSFTDTAQIATTSQVCSLASADFDLDGDPDLAVGTGQPNFAVEIFDNQAGTFVSVNTLSAPAGWATGVVARDLDGDGLPDLAVAEQGDIIKCKGQLIRIHANAGGFQFNQRAIYSTGCQPFDMTSGDFDGVNGVDLATADRISGWVSVFLNDGSGGFSNSTTYTIKSLAAPYSVHAADLDADGLDDLVVLERENSSTAPVHVLWSTGSGFKFREYGSLIQVGPIGTGDLDEDGLLDIVVGIPATINHEGWFTVLRNQGRRDFSLGISQFCGVEPMGVVVADLDPSNTRPEIAISERSGNAVSVFLQTGTPWPALELTPSELGLFPADWLTLTASRGSPSAPLLAAIVTVNGSPTFQPIALSTFDAAGQWQTLTKIPSGLTGLHLELVVYGFDLSGALSASNWSELQFF